jgi:hypothetical protein
VRFLQITSIAMLAAALCACGGGGGNTTTANTTATLSGIASAGAPITGASISVLSSNGLYLETSATTDTTGGFQISIDTQTYTSPYLLKITKSSGQSVGNYYAYASANSSAGILVTPISNATLGLAANANLDQIFASGAIPSALTTNSIDNALEKVYAASSNVFSALSVTDKSKLLVNASYAANGSGQDASLDAVSFSSASATDGSVIVGSKLTGNSVKIDNSTTVGSISSIPFNNNGTGLLVAINTSINQVNNCIKNAINNNTSSPNCFDDSYMGSGLDKAHYVSTMRSDISQLTSIGASSVKWCIFDNASLSFNSTTTQLAGSSGICNATFSATATDGAGVISEYYKFTLNNDGATVATVKAIGNGVNDDLDIGPSILSKLRVDGFTENIGITSGYKFRIGTALQSTNGNPVVTSTSNLSAKVEILNASGTNLDTFYMECNQGASCIDSALAVCKDKSATCANGVDRTADNIISVNSSLANTIISALQQGFVSARITTYNKILSDNTKQQRYQKTLPIIGLPIPQDVASQITFPSLTTSGASALANWTGQTSVELGFNRGDSRVALMEMDFTAQPSAGVNGKSVTLKKSMTSATFNGLVGNGTAIIPATSTGCQNVGNSANWRGVYINGTFNNVPVTVKQFGSCYSGNY